MKFLIVVAAFVAVAVAQRERRSAVLGYAAPGTVVQGPSSVISGPSGTIVSDTGSIATGGVLAAPAAYSAYTAPAAYSAYAAPAAYSAYAAPLAYAAHPAAYAAHAYAAPLAYSGHAYGAPLAYAAPGVTAGTVVAPGTTLIGPNTNGAPGAVITGY